ncbi:MAG: acyl-CoA dehydrogenase [Acidimicrobiaceae bacterium]|nr:acyl-CoA dehydrogenase [Acidimicrobiaceae bacterium]|tara:strand:+ start:97 stop:1113 length:1017 start_codon:yes stop_codon:yes gene_type:complete
MYLRLNSDELAIKDIFNSFFESECSVERVRSAQHEGFDPKAWERFVETGAPGMCLPESSGGGGASLTTGAIVADLLGEYIAPLPFIEHLVASRLLSLLNPEHDLLPSVASGEKIITLALKPTSGDTAKIVPAGAIADAVIVNTGSDLILIVGKDSDSYLRNTADLPLGNRSLAEGEIIATGSAALSAFNRAINEWQALMAVALTGLGRKAVDIGVSYAKERYQFGVLIGSFQGLQHGFASSITGVEGSHFLSSRAISALENNTDMAESLSGMAFLFASESALNAAATSLQYHGGYGFAEEYDIQLYYRRAKGWPLQLGDPGLEYQRIANLCLPSGKVA